MIFLRYESFRSYLRLYPVTAIIIAINLAVFLYDWISGSNTLLYHGAFIVDPPSDPYGLTEPWRYVTAVFLHAGFDHILFNMFAVLVFAPPLERMLGKARYAVFFLFCGVMGNAVSAMFADDVLISVGASGAIYGLYGAYLYLATMKKTLDEGSKKTVYSILAFGVIYSLLVPGINMWAHFGGAIAGFLYALWYDRMLLKRS
ncbi:rhomboid family intramembrane serine protease [Paenibacillus phyllosphaerae]|nr:rhomboid family intramembrane serine protease [Paenibacillus phyllosphaerae]